MMFAAVPDIVLENFGSFLLGMLAGFILSNRFKIVRRNGNSNTPPRAVEQSDDGRE